MKRGTLVILSVILVIVLLSFAGCGGKKTTAPKKTNTSKSNATAPSTQTNMTIPPAKGPMTKIDLLILDAYFSPIYASANEDVKFKFIVKNQGTEEAPSFGYNVKIYKDSIVWKEESQTYNNSLGRGNTTKISKMYSFPSNGKYYAEIYIDPSNNINELVETNNYMKTKAELTVLDKAAINAATPSSSDGNETEEE